MKKFREVIGNSSDLHESSFLQKGFALTQAAKHQSERQKFESSLSKADSHFRAGARSQLLERKLDELFAGLSQLTLAMKSHARLSTAEINVAVANTVLNQDIQKALAKEFRNRSRKR